MKTVFGVMKLTSHGLAHWRGSAVHPKDVDLALAIQRLPLDKLPIFENVSDARRFAETETALIYQIDIYTEQEHVSAKTFFERVDENSRYSKRQTLVSTHNIHGISAVTVVEYPHSYYGIVQPETDTVIPLRLTSLGFPRIHTVSQTSEQTSAIHECAWKEKLLLLDAIRVLKWYGSTYGTDPNVPLNVRFSDYKLFEHIRNIELAAAQLSPIEYFNKMKQLNSTLSLLIQLWQVDSQGMVTIDRPLSTLTHQEFVSHVRELYLSSTSQTYRNLGYALLAVAVIIPVCAVAGALTATVATVGTIAALVVSYGLFSRAENDPGRQLENAALALGQPAARVRLGVS